MHPKQDPSLIINSNSLPELTALSVRTDLPTAKRLEQFRRDAGNPYRYRCGPIEVEVEFTPSGQPLQRRLEQFLTELKARPTCGP